MRGEVHLAKGAFPDQPPDGIVPYAAEVLRRELSGSCSLDHASFQLPDQGKLTPVTHCKNWRAVRQGGKVSHFAREPE